MNGKPPVIVRRLLLAADEELQLAHLVLRSSTNHAAKFAYMATFHAAQAAILFAKGDAPKTHKGVRNAFALLARDNAALGAEMGRFLARAYQYKEAADYKIKTPMPAEEAKRAMAKAADIVAKVKYLVSATG